MRLCDLIRRYPATFRPDSPEQPLDRAVRLHRRLLRPDASRTPHSRAFTMELTTDICVIGGGIAGLTLARALAGEGADVVVVDRGAIGEGTAVVAAGMLAPLVEARLEERSVVAFGYEALRGYPAYVAALEAETGIGVDYRADGTLIVAVDRDDAAQLRHGFDEQRALGLPMQWWTGYECRRAEPALSPGIAGGIFSADDHQVDNRRLMSALVEACRRHPRITLVPDAGDGVLDGTTYRGAGCEIAAADVVMATGARTDLLRRVAPHLAAAVRPVKGQILRLDQSASPLIDHVIRTPDVYLAPKSDGMIALGASSEDRGFDAAITAGEVMELLRAAWECVPGIFELPIAETRVGFRPASIDHEPMLGASGVDRLWLAMGYYRHGILFAPLAARLLAARIVRGERSAWLDTFSPERFDEAHVQRPVA